MFFLMMLACSNGEEAIASLKRENAVLEAALAAERTRTTVSEQREERDAHDLKDARLQVLAYQTVQRQLKNNTHNRMVRTEFFWGCTQLGGRRIEVTDTRKPCADDEATVNFEVVRAADTNEVLYFSEPIVR